MKVPIYFDYHATTPLDPEVWAVMQPYFTEHFGNAASKQHAYGWVAEAAVEQARERVAQALGVQAQEIIFTSGATEANNLALFGVAQAYQQRGRHIISVATEHKSVLEPLAVLARHGFQVTVLPVDRFGRLELEQLEAALTAQTVLVSVMAANNEIGTLQDLTAISALLHPRGILLHTDAAQAIGKIPLDVSACDLLSVSGHKIYGPKGIGALYVRSREPHVRIEAQLYGGGHERGLRSGTLAVPLIVGLGQALHSAQQKHVEEASRLAALRDQLYQSLCKELGDVHLHGHPTLRLPHNLNVSFAGVKSADLLCELPGLAFSTGSACSSGSRDVSHVLRALNLSEDLGRGAVRFGLGRWTTADDVKTAQELIVAAVKRLRQS